MRIQERHLLVKSSSNSIPAQTLSHSKFITSVHLQKLEVLKQKQKKVLQPKKSSPTPLKQHSHYPPHYVGLEKIVSVFPNTGPTSLKDENVTCCVTRTKPMMSFSNQCYSDRNKHKRRGFPTPLNTELTEITEWH